MTQQFICSVNADKFTLAIHGEPRTYPNDKTGKRQAILDGLNAIPAVPVGQDSYLPSREALQLVAAVMYPDGIQTEAAYQTVCQVTEKACDHIGFGVEVELGPPLVPFEARGSYRKRYPPVSAQQVDVELDGARISATLPRREIACTVLWNKAGFEIYGRHWSQITSAQQAQIQEQVDAIIQQAGWQKIEAGSACLYVQPLPVNKTAVKEQLREMLLQASGRPITRTVVVNKVQLGAYGRGFYSNELSSEQEAMVTELLQTYGYNPHLDDGAYWPNPLDLKLPPIDELTVRLAGLPTVMTVLGEGITLSDLVHTVVGDSATLDDWQKDQLVQTGPVSQALRRLGYKTEITWCQPYQFQPKRSDSLALPLLLSAVRVTTDLTKKVSLAKGLAVFTPALAIDDGENGLVYLEMVGAKESVKANWAALMGGNRVHWIGTRRIEMEGMKQHIKIQTTLPCGWVSQVLLHKQASLKEMNPERPFYLLDDGAKPKLCQDGSLLSAQWSIPPLFYPMLNKCLSLPLLAEWSGYLWENGRERNLITLLDKGNGQGYAAWRVLPTPDEWQKVVQEGLQSQAITF
ncbi:MAG: hypothetical protein IPM53_25110 [Anaerolineaceae bacterium]|nr:hypothetical protein [Anaerolineaceae bacterium]